MTLSFTIAVKLQIWLSFADDIFSKWNDANCGIKRAGYACKKPREGGWTTPAPTQAPKGY